MLDKLYFFGTDLENHGHYFFEIDKEGMRKSKVYFNNIPFNPEDFFLANSPKGIVQFYRCEVYHICAINGSCVDTRPGTKSVFWTSDASVDITNFKEEILSFDICKRMIKQMQFEVKW